MGKSITAAKLKSRASQQPSHGGTDEDAVTFKEKQKRKAGMKHVAVVKGVKAVDGATVTLL